MQKQKKKKPRAAKQCTLDHLNPSISCWNDRKSKSNIGNQRFNHKNFHVGLLKNITITCLWFQQHPYPVQYSLLLSCLQKSMHQSSHSSIKKKPKMFSLIPAFGRYNLQDIFGKGHFCPILDPQTACLPYRTITLWKRHPYKQFPSI